MYIDKHSGKKYTQEEIDKKLSQSKAAYRLLQREDYYTTKNFCEHCKAKYDEIGLIPPETLEYQIIDVSHIKSIRKCKDEGEIELIWTYENYTLLCRKHHIEYEDSQKSLHNTKIEDICKKSN